MGQQPAATTVALPPGPLLPQTFGAWKQTGVSELPPCEGNACLQDKEFGLKRGAVGIYERTDGKKTRLTIQAKDMVDATGAYSAFTLSRSGMRSCAESAKLGRDCVLAPGHLLFWQGETLVDVKAEGSDPIRLPELAPLVDALPKPRGTKAALPILPGRLPEEGLDRDSIRYAVGPATYAQLQMPVPVDQMGFNKSAEVVLAKYRGRVGSGWLAIVYYPTNQIAGDRARAMEEALKGSSGVAVRRVTNLVAVAYGGFTETQAKAIVGKVTSAEKLTIQNSDLYQPKGETLQTSVSILMKIMVFVISMTLAALVLGVFFGGGRALIRKLQGKPLSSLEDMEIIKLEIGGKPSTKLETGDTAKGEPKANI